MEKYILTSKVFSGEVIITEDNRKLQADFTGSSVSLEQQKFILGKMQLGIAGMLSHFNTPPTDCEMKKLVIDFSMFWDKYDDKFNSSKKRTKMKWDKMSEIERTKAYNFIGRYFASIPQGTRKKYAETYLNAELWNN